MQVRLEQYLSDCDRVYSAEHAMLGQPYHGPGYHSRVPAGAWVHPVRESSDYALALLLAGGCDGEQRAVAILRQVLSLQDTNPLSRTYGVWPWLLEESLAEMDPPDLNWADFIGARLAQALVMHSAQLPADLAAAMRASLGHAAWAIYRRNVGPGYTNIAVMGGGVTALAGELLDEPVLLDYARRRLANVIAHAEYHGTFVEYNSPTYTVVALREAERILALARDAVVRSHAETLRGIAWKVIAEHYHPGTGQWAGPHGRSYSDHLAIPLAEYLAEQTGATIQPHPQAKPGHLELIPALPCPSEWRERFRRLPEQELTVRQRFVRAATDTIGTTWLAADACLGSVSYDCLWSQRRAVLGYWKTDRDPAVVLRLRFLHDGRDCCSSAVANAQDRNRVLSVIGLLSNMGDFHPFHDHPADARFRAEDFRVRYELSGLGVTARTLGQGRFALVAGDRQAVVHTLPATFGNHAVEWELGNDENRVFLDGICYRGRAREFDFKTLPVCLVFGLELLRADEPLSASFPGLHSREPLAPREFTWAQTSEPWTP